MLTIENVSKYYGQGAKSVRALSNVSLAVHAGETCAIVGPSGCGKTTLLNLASSVDLPSAGYIGVNDTPVSDLDEDERAAFRREHVGIVFQFFNLLPTLTAEENVAVPLLLSGARLKDAIGRARSSLAQVGLDKRFSHLPQELSGGEMQRVSIARAFVSEPTLLIADEPTGSLDSQQGAQILELIKNLVATYRPAVLLATHSSEVANFADRTVTLSDGMLVS